MKLKDLISEYGEYEVIDKTKFKTWDATLPEEKSASIQFESHEGIEIRLEPPKPKTVWDLKKGDKHYWTGYDGRVEGGNSIWIDSDSDKNARETGNVFLTKKETEQDIERRKVETLLLKHGGRRWLSHTIPNYYLVVNGFNELYFTSILSSQYPQGIIYFNSGSDVQNAINEIGAERIIKALFEVR